MSQKYTWRDGMPPPKVSADIFGDVVEKIEAAKGTARAEDILAEARKPRSPIGKMFEWDDRKAGESWRLSQAGSYLGGLMKVTVLVETGETISHRALLVAKPAGDKRRSYQLIDKIIGDDVMKAQIIDGARRELEAYIRKYASIIALSTYVPRLNEIVAEMRDEIDSLALDAKRRAPGKTRRGVDGDERPAA